MPENQTYAEVFPLNSLSPAAGGDPLYCGTNLISVYPLRSAENNFITIAAMLSLRLLNGGARSLSHNVELRKAGAVASHVRLQRACSKPATLQAVRLLLDQQL